MGIRPSATGYPLPPGKTMIGRWDGGIEVIDAEPPLPKPKRKIR